jgi:hypothetical protein
MGAGALAPGRVCTEFPKDKEFGAFEMLEKIGFSLKPRRCGTTHVHTAQPRGGPGGGAKDPTGRGATQPTQPSWVLDVLF